ncbi:MAG: hypothetical protein ACHWZW_02380 [Spirulina sp.]
MTSLTVTPALSWPLCSCAWTSQPQRRRGSKPDLPTIPEQRPYSLTQLQAQAEAEAQSESAALWEVMMRPA